MDLKKNMKMADLVHLNYLLLNVLNRFGISLGFGDSTVEDVCNKNRIDVNFFLDIANTYHHKDFFPQKQLQKYPVQSILKYLKNTHYYYIEKKLPELELLLTQTIKVCYKDEKTSDLIISFFSGYKEQLTLHIEKEERDVFPYVYWLENVQIAKDVPEDAIKRFRSYSIEQYKNTHDDVEEKLADLQNLIIKYLPEPCDMYACNKLLFEIFTLENDLNDHSRIEEKVMIPIALSMEKEIKDKLSKIKKLITVFFAIKSYIIRKGLISIMQNLNLEFSYEEVKQTDAIYKLQNKTEKQVIFFCPEDFPEINGNLPAGWNRNTRILILKKGTTLPFFSDCYDTVDLLQTKNVLQNQLLKTFRSLKGQADKDESPEALSDREKVIMRELVLGYTNKEIADRLFISPHTVIAHRKNITGKLAIKSVPGLTIYAILNKIISEEDIKRATQPSSDPDSHK